MQGHAPLRRPPFTMSRCLSAPAAYVCDFSLKRVALPAVCLLRRPEKAAFFFVGVRQKFSFLLQRSQRYDNNKVMFEELYVAGCLTMLAAGLMTILDGIWRR